MIMENVEKIKKNRVDKKYLEWLKSQLCSNPKCPGIGGDIIPAHMRILGNAGIGIKPPDRDALPLCFFCHTAEHEGVITFWRQETKEATKEFVKTLCNKHLERYHK